MLREKKITMNYQLGKEKKFFSEKLPRPRTNYHELPILVKKLPNRNVKYMYGNQKVSSRSVNVVAWSL